VIAANWSSPTAIQAWPDLGHSCIITRKGKVLAMSETVSGNDIVYGDLEIKKSENVPPEELRMDGN
jgi:hypothetical protein